VLLIILIFTSVSHSMRTSQVVATAYPNYLMFTKHVKVITSHKNNVIIIFNSFL